MLLILAVLALLWLLRGMRRPPPPPPTDSGHSPRPMLACAHCGVHLPSDEALPGRGGVFCGDAHRKAYEEAHAGS